jgi:26S proteasome regulatory subunit N7
MADETPLPIPNLKLTRHAWALSQPGLDHAAARTALLAGIEADAMGPYYAALTSSGVLPLDEATAKGLQEKNEAALAALDAKHADAVENLGETEVADALKAKAQYLAQIGENVSLTDCVC